MQYESLPRSSSSTNLLGNNCQKADGEFYSLGSAQQYLSGVKEVIRRKHPDLELWIGHTGRNQSGGYGWYDEIRYAASKEIAARIFGSGEALTDQSYPMGRHLLKELIRNLMKSDDLDVLEACSVLVYNFLTVGRAGEASFSSWKSTFYHYDVNSAVFYCPMAKVQNAKTTSIFNDALYYQLDPYFHFACYWMIDGGRHHMTQEGKDFKEKEHWVFPSMALKSNPKKILNDCIKETFLVDTDAKNKTVLMTGTLYECTSAVGSNYTLTSLRDGAISMLLDHPDLCGPSRSGHDHEKFM